MFFFTILETKDNTKSKHALEGYFISREFLPGILQKERKGTFVSCLNFIRGWHYPNEPRTFYKRNPDERWTLGGFHLLAHWGRGGGGKITWKVPVLETLPNPPL